MEEVVQGVMHLQIQTTQTLEQVLMGLLLIYQEQVISGVVAVEVDNMMEGKQVMVVKVEVVVVVGLK
jgi:hypothetical protein